MTQQLKFVVNTGNYQDVEFEAHLNKTVLSPTVESFGHKVFTFNKDLEKNDRIISIVRIDSRLLSGNPIIGNINFTLYIDDREITSVNSVDTHTYPYTMIIDHVVK